MNPSQQIALADLAGLRWNKRYSPDQPRDEHGRFGEGSGDTKDANAEAAKGLQSLLQQVKDSGKNFGSWSKLAEQGHVGRTEPFTPEEKKDLAALKAQVGNCKLGMCFMNSQRLAMAGIDDPRVQLVEGLVATHGVPIDHSWIEFNGKVYDPTLYPGGDTTGKAKMNYTGGHGYFGITVPKDEISNNQYSTGRYSPLSHSRDPKLSSKIWK